MFRYILIILFMASTCGALELEPWRLWGTQRANCLGGIYDFDGTSDVISVADSSLLSFGNSTVDEPFSVGAWIFMDDATLFRMFGKIGGTTGYQEWFLTTNGSDTLLFVLYDDNSGHQVKQNSDATMTQFEGQWIHVMATYSGNEDSSGITLYVDGTVFASTAAPVGSYVAMENTLGTLEIGSVDAWFASGDADGKMTDIRIYDIELTAAQVLTLYQTGDVAPADLVAHYRFAGNADDETANNLDGTPSGPVNSTDPDDFPPCLPWRTVCPKGAYDYDGVNDEITVSDDSLLSFTDGAGNDKAFTITYWYKQGTWNVQDVHLGKMGSGSTTYEWFIYHSNQTYGPVLLLYESNGSDRIGQRADVPITAGEWEHWAITYDGSESVDGFTWYKNGSSVASTDSSSGTYTGTHDDTADMVFMQTTWNSNFADGHVGETMIFLRELTANEIQNYYRFGKKPADSGDLVAHWDFYGNANDLSPNGLDGTVSGAVNTTDPADLYACRGPQICVAGGYTYDGTDKFEQSTLLDTFPSAFSVMVWWKQGAGAKAGYAFSKYNQYTSGSNQDRFHLYFDPSEDEFRILHAGGGGSPFILTSSETLSDGVWYHAAATWDTTNGLILYRDGVEVASDGTATTLPNNGTHDDAGLGYYDAGNLFANNGSAVSECILYSRTLSAAEISDYYTKGTKPTGSKIASYYFDGDATDSTASYDWTVTGATLTQDPADLPECAPR